MNYAAFCAAKVVVLKQSGERFTIDYVDPDVPYLVIVSELGSKFTCAANRLEIVR